MDTVIFDLDGTLADTSPDLIAAANASFAEIGAGAPLDESADRLTAFHGGRAMLRLGFSRLGQSWSEAEIDARYARFLTHYEDRIDARTRLYPGAVAAIEALRSAGFATGICTNKPERLAEILLGRLGVRDLFASLIGADTLPVRKPDPAPYRLSVERAGGTVGRSLLIGDTETDVTTARAAGVPVVLVGFGPEGAAIGRLAPDAMIASFDELLPLALRLLG